MAMVASLIAALSHIDLESGGFASPQRSQSVLKKDILKIRADASVVLENGQESLHAGCHQQHLHSDHSLIPPGDRRHFVKALLKHLFGVRRVAEDALYDMVDTSLIAHNQVRKKVTFSQAHESDQLLVARLGQIRGGFRFQVFS